MLLAASAVDWQFWAATALAGLAAAWLVRFLWSIIRPPRSRRTRATLTLNGRPLN